MSSHLQEISDGNVTSEQSPQSRERSIINNTDHPMDERLALVRSITDRLELSLDDIRNSGESSRLDSLNIIPPDLLPFEINLKDGKKITIMETNPVVTLYDGEINNLEGDVIHVFMEKGDKLPRNLTPPNKTYTVTAKTFETILPQIINDLIIQSNQKNKCLPIPGTSKKLEAPSNATSQDSFACKSKQNEDELMDFSTDQSKISNKPVEEEPTRKDNSIMSNTASAARDHNPVVEACTQPELENQMEHEDSTEKNLLVPETNIKNSSSPFMSKFQVIGLVDTGIFRDSGSEEEFHITGDIDNKDWAERKDTATIIVDKELGNPSDFRSVYLKTPPPVPEKVSSDLRKSSRKRKPKIKSPFKSWDEVKLGLHSKKVKTKRIPVQTENKIMKKKIKKSALKIKSIEAKNDTKF